jgi:DNA-binding CsgD family transcriptional regulator
MTGKSHRLRIVDVRNVFRLIGEITELGRGPSLWRLHLLQKLLPLINARFGLAGEQYVSSEAPRFVGMVEVGWLPREQEIFYEHVNTGGMAKDPLHEPVQKLLHRSFTRRRRDLVSDEIWYASPTTPVRRQCNIDDQIYSRWKLPQSGWAHVITTMRAWGAEPFSVRDRLMVAMLHRELGRLWSQIDTGPLATLPPRLRQTLDLIFSGYSEKEMAQTLNVSLHTIHDFSRRLYRHFGVTGRSRLQTNPACRRLFLRPALSPAYYVHDRRTSDRTIPFTSNS